MALFELTLIGFDEFINSAELVVVDFYAEWCGPCKMLSPILSSVSDSFPNIPFGKVNMDREEKLINKFNITSVPTVYFFKKGKLVDSFVGYKPKEIIVSIINKHL